ncbi:hypothetical protein TeGR_g5276, partial [Tetraparma gracilis]
YLGYAFGVAAVPAMFLAAVVEKPRFRNFLEGSPDGGDGSQLGRRIVGAWREYYTADKVTGEVAGFHNEDWGDKMHKRTMGSFMGEEELKIRVEVGAGMVETVELEKGGGLERASAEALGSDLAKNATRVEFLDDSSPTSVGGAATGGEELWAAVSSGSSPAAEEGPPALLSLTQNASSWASISASSDSPAAPARAPPPPPESSSARQKRLRALKVADLDSKIAYVTAQVGNPSGTTDIDTLLEQRDRLKRERREIVGFLGGIL